MGRSEEKKKKKDHKSDKKRNRHEDRHERRSRDVRRHGDKEEGRSSRSKRDHKEDKKRKRTERDGERKRSRKEPRKSALLDRGEPTGQPPSVPLDEGGDYYAYHQHLRVYLFREEGVSFEDLKDTSQAKMAFARFVNRYNAGKLEKVYYESSTMPPDLLAECTPVRKTWNFQASQTEEESLRLLKDGVRQNTEYHQITSPTDAEVKK